MIKGKKILVGISGGIAAYKICNLVRLLIKAGAEVKVIMTPSATKIVSPLTLSVLSGNEVIVNMFSDENYEKSVKVSAGTWHIDNNIWADLFIIAPATANTIAKIVAGIADNYLLTAIMAARCPVLLSPSMDLDMYNNPITKENLEKLKKRGFKILNPEVGKLASGLEGIGRLPEPEKLFDFIESNLIKKDLKGKRIMVTAGPTLHKIDPVRFISNFSSGKMGFELAKAAKERCAEVFLITGPVHLDCNESIKRIDIETTEEMFEEVNKYSPSMDLIIMAAAVSDYKVKNIEKNKIKKKSETLSLEFERTVDILKNLGDNKKGYHLYGFALETENYLSNAKEKLITKNLDMIILNRANEDGAGFKVDTNIITLISKDFTIELPMMSKYEVANKILDVYVKSISN